MRSRLAAIFRIEVLACAGLAVIVVRAERSQLQATNELRQSLDRQTRVIQQIAESDRLRGATFGASQRSDAATQATVADQGRAIATLQQQVGRAKETPSAAEARPPSAAEASAAQRGHELVMRAIERRAWTATDRDQLRSSMQGMTDEDQKRVIAELVVALNAQKVRVDDGPPI